MRNLRRALRALGASVVVIGAMALGCSSSPSSGPSSSHADGGGQAVSTTISPTRQAELDAIQARLDEVKNLDAAGFAAKYNVPFVTSLGYDPLSAKGLDLVGSSSFALNDTEKSALGANGFVTTNRKRFPSFIYGYENIYADDLPVYLSADSILYAVHDSFDDILKLVEGESLRPKLHDLLAGMRASLAAGGGAAFSAAARANADLYLSVAASLLDGTFSPPVAGGDASSAKALFDGAMAGEGMRNIELFGVGRDIDFSQFKPRGHYTESTALQTYFRATMWLGRIEFRILETQPDHTQVFRRSQLEAAYVLRALIDGAGLSNWKNIDSVIGAFVGEPDNMTLPQLDNLLADLHVPDAASLAGLSDAVIAQAVVNGGYGAQRISSQIMINGLGSGTMPLSSTFLLLGQRYVIDSHVFSNVVYDRVDHGNVRRMMPNPLDVGFAAIGNDQAGMLLGTELARYPYAPELASMRVLADAHPQEYWEGSLYTEWLSLLRTLSPASSTIADPASAGLPRVTGTEPWGRRLLNAQMASWAELRHDTILYTKQSYTGGASCEYPDAYVEPYPEFYAKLAAFASRGTAAIANANLPNPASVSAITAYFEKLRSVAGILEAMAKNQRTGAPHTAEQLAFVNQLTFVQGCGSVADFDGWYAQLFFQPSLAIEFDPVVADVHTQPTDEGGATVGRVLHVGTGMPRAMVVTVETCTGPRAYVGLTSAYHEKITEQFDRLTDERWMVEVSQGLPEVPWMTNLVQP